MDFVVVPGGESLRNTTPRYFANKNLCFSRTNGPRLCAKHAVGKRSFAMEGGEREKVEIEGLISLNHRFVSKFSLSGNELKILCFMLLFTKMMVLQLRKFVLNFTVSNF